MNCEGGFVMNDVFPSITSLSLHPCSVRELYIYKKGNNSFSIPSIYLSFVSKDKRGCLNLQINSDVTCRRQRA